MHMGRDSLVWPYIAIYGHICLYQDIFNQLDQACAAILEKQDDFDSKHLSTLQMSYKNFMTSLQDDWKAEIEELDNSVASRDLTGILFKVAVHILNGPEDKIVEEKDAWYNNMEDLTFKEACNPSYPLYTPHMPHICPRYIPYMTIYGNIYGHIWHGINNFYIGLVTTRWAPVR